MKFINLGEPIKIRIGKSHDCYWDTLKTNEIIDLPKRVGHRLKLTKLKTTEGQIGSEKVETKQISVPQKSVQNDDLYFKELIKIKGIGVKTAKDIVVWGTKEKLLEHVKRGYEMPFRDDVVKLLEKKYG